MFARELGEERLAQTVRLAAERHDIAGAVGDVVVPPVGNARGRRKPAPLCTEDCSAVFPRVPELRVGELVIIESTPAQGSIVDREAERSDEVKPGTDIGTQPDDAAGVRGDLRLNQPDFEHYVHLPD